MSSRPVKVSQLNSYIKRVLQTDPILGDVSVIGEISNLKFHGSGHVYFSLKDENSKINCFLASDRIDYVNCIPEEGLEVTACGYIYLYERGGSYSLNIRDMEASGQGDLAAAFEKLKRRLEKEGIFDKSHKKELPFFPEKIAVVTSDTGAAVRDILKIIRNKNHYVDILIYPVLVQGPEAPREISHAIDDINENHQDVDVIITGRGGGSMEELSAFNDERIARSIYESQIPVISAVGHETDFTIADFAADVRAETPTAAAEIAVPDTEEIREHMDGIKEDMERSISNMIGDKKKILDMMDPKLFFREIESRIALDRFNIDDIISDMGNDMKSIMSSLENRLHVLSEALEASSPKAVLERGYCIVTDTAGKVVSDMTALKEKQVVNIKAARGSAGAVITDIGKE